MSCSRAFRRLIMLWGWWESQGWTEDELKIEMRGVWCDEMMRTQPRNREWRTLNWNCFLQILRSFYVCSISRGRWSERWNLWPSEEHLVKKIIFFTKPLSCFKYQSEEFINRTNIKKKLIFSFSFLSKEFWILSTSLFEFISKAIRSQSNDQDTFSPSQCSTVFLISNIK